MAILYALVARGSVVLAEFSAAAVNAGAVARQILERIPDSQDTHASYSQDRYVFHVKRTDGLTVLCVADDTAGSESFLFLHFHPYLPWIPAADGRIPFAFLEDIHGRFVKAYGRACHTAPAYAMNDEFSRILSQQIDYYSNDPNADRMNRIKGEMSQDYRWRCVGKGVYRTYALCRGMRHMDAVEDAFHGGDVELGLACVANMRLRCICGGRQVKSSQSWDESVRNVMIENIDKVLGRGERLELLVDKTANMQGNTIRFRKQARRFRNTAWWRNIKLTIALILLIVIIIYVVLAFFCHGLTLPACIR
ncbi:hypothetical protein ZIOFF_048923 [Zingiber officinale]|uniref:Uncharacterized protein n=1 Tax=Zingiber officinale TaxID=94328 RepID=A0A8J5FQG3_ZINOF|nr:hypothetical protein ZIOFF_048923 [Zingiber officinale]